MASLTSRFFLDALFFITSLMFRCSLCYKISISDRTDVLWVSMGGTSTVLREIWEPGCSTVYVTDGKTPYASLLKVIESVKLESNTVVIETILQKEDNEALIAAFDIVTQIRKSSRCMNLVLVSDDKTFLNTFVASAASKEDLLVWPTKVLVVTRLLLQNFHDMGPFFSTINGMILILEETASSKRCSIYMFLPYSHRLVHVASWNAQSGFSYVSDNQHFPKEIHNFQDRPHLRVVGQNFPPHLTVKRIVVDGDQKDAFAFSGPMVMLLNILAYEMNFTYEIVRPPDGSWGYLFPNGTWNGMIGMLLRKEIDLGLGPFGFTYLRAQAIDYANPLVVDYGQILGRRGNTEVDPWSFALPLTTSVWLATFASLCAVLAIAKLSDWTSSPSPKITAASYLRAFLVQDVSSKTNASWERVLLAFWMLSVFILIECYSTNLMSLLAVRYISEPYQSVRDLLDDPNIKITWFANTAHTQYLSGVDSGIFYELAEAGRNGKFKLITPAEYVPVVEEFVARGDHVMINPFLIMKIFLTEDYMDKGNCKYYVSKEKFLPLTFSMTVPKNSPLRGAINEGIRAVVEGGLYNYWTDEAIPNSGSCKNPPSKITVKASLALTNTWGIFVVLIGGYVISLLTLGLEIIASKQLTTNSFL